MVDYLSVEDFVNLFLLNIIPVALSRKAVADATTADPVLTLLIEYKNQSNISDYNKIRHFKAVFEELCVS